MFSLPGSIINNVIHADNRLDSGSVSLRQFLQNNKLELPAFFAIAIQLTQTLGEVHQKEVVHGNLKPENILIQPETGSVQIIDFSNAVFVGGEKQNSVLSMVSDSPAGTPEYMSPEQTGRTRYHLDQRSDLYSLGVVLYEILTGQLPFQAAQPIGWVHAHLAQIPTPPETVNSAVPQAVSVIIMKLLSKTPEDRYQQAASLWADLAECHRQWEQTGIG